MSEAIKIILPARQIPEGTVVTKITGTKRYTIHDSVTVRIFPNSPKGTTIKPERGTRVIIPAGEGSDALVPDAEGVISLGTVNADTELIGHFSPIDASKIVTSLVDGTAD